MEIKIVTPRLVIQPILSKEATEIHGLLSLPETDEYNALGIPKNITATKALVKEWMSNHKQPRVTSYTLSIRLSDSSEFVGLFGITVSSAKYSQGVLTITIPVQKHGKDIKIE